MRKYFCSLGQVIQLQSTQTYVTSYTSTRKTTKRKNFCCDFSYGRFQTHKKQTFDVKMLKKNERDKMGSNFLTTRE